MNDTTLTATERIHAFAGAVRVALADLPAEEVDDLVEGLVGDLTDQAADHGGEIELGDPAAYAQELRDAAGLPERGPGFTSKTPWHERVAASAGRFVGRIRSSTFGAWLLDLLIALRPVWWVLRGLGIWWLLVTATPIGGYAGIGGMSWALLLGCVLLSVQWGRGRWLPKNAWRHIRTVASVLAVLVLPIAIGSLFAAVSGANNHPSDTTPITQGLLLDGAQIENLFVYDKDGNLIEGAQLYTNRGTPVDLFGRDGADVSSGLPWTGLDEDGKAVVPFRDAAGRAIWNIYPLMVGRIDENGSDVDASKAQLPQPPFLRAPGRSLTGSPAPTPGATTPATPTPGGSGAPTPAPSPTPTPAG